MIEFRSSNGEGTHSYACEKGPSAEAIKARAAKAHRFFDRRINSVAERFTSGMLAGMGSGSKPDFKSLSAQLDAGAEKAVEDTEQRYQCLFFNTKENGVLNCRDAFWQRAFEWQFEFSTGAC